MKTKKICEPTEQKKWPWIKDRIPFMNITIDNVTMEEAVACTKQLAKEGNGAYVVTPNVDHMIKLHQDDTFAKIYADADLILADGTPIMWFAKGFGTPLKEKVSGSDLFPRVCKMAADEKLSVFFLGGMEGVAKQAAKVLKRRYPTLSIVGIISPPFGFEKDETQMEEICKAIRDAGPDILFVGLGAPKQEKFFEAIKERVNVPVALHIGGSFDFVAGTIKRAPKWMSKIGLEWFYRMCKEPKRMFKRYMIDDMQIFGLYLRYRIQNKQKKEQISE